MKIKTSLYTSHIFLLPGSSIILHTFRNLKRSSESSLPLGPPEVPLTDHGSGRSIDDPRISNAHPMIMVALTLHLQGLLSELAFVSQWIMSLFGLVDGCARQESIEGLGRI